MKLSRILKIAVLATGILSLLAACGLTPNPADPLKGTSWSLVDLDGTHALAGRTVTASFADGQISGSAGCNSYGGAYTVVGDKLQIKAIISTMMACAGAGVMEQEAAFLRALGNAQSFKLTGGQLQILTSDGKTLTFAPGVAQ